MNLSDLKCGMLLSFFMFLVAIAGLTNSLTARWPIDEYLVGLVVVTLLLIALILLRHVWRDSHKE